MPTTVKYYHTAKAAYAAELKKLQKSLDTLSGRVKAARGDGKLSNKIHWAHVGDLKHFNMLLDRAIEESRIERVK